MMMSGQSAEQLRQHARSAFEASETLLRQAANGGGSTDRFYRAANRYASTLRSLGGLASSRGGTSGDNTGAAGSSGPGGGARSRADLASVAVINHGVKEALDSLQIKQMVRTMGGEGDAARVLRDHARQMDSESLQAIEGFSRGGGGRSGGSGTGAAGAGGTGTTGAGTSDAATSGRGTPGAATSGSGRSGDTATTGVATSGAGGGDQGGNIESLAQQAQEVLEAIRELDRSTGEKSGDGHGGSGSGSGSGSRRDGAGTGNQEGRSPQ